MAFQGKKRFSYNIFQITSVLPLMVTVSHFGGKFHQIVREFILYSVYHKIGMISTFEARYESSSFNFKTALGV